MQYMCNENYNCICILYFKWTAVMYKNQINISGYGKPRYVFHASFTASETTNAHIFLIQA